MLYTLKLIGLWVMEWLWCLSDLLLKPRKLPYHMGYRREMRCGRLDTKAWQSWNSRSFTIRSDYGYLLDCELIDNAARMMRKSVSDKQIKEGKKIAVLCHGHGCAKYSSLKYADMFLRLGFAVLVYDHRNHGYSGRALTSMGYFERFDLRKIIDWCYRCYGQKCCIITHGESMGAATVLMHLGIDQRVKCAIADCAYSDLKLLLSHQLKQFYHLPGFLIPVESLLTYLRAGFWYKEVSPGKVAAKADIPILFIHGKLDNMVPAAMSKQMYAVKKKDKAIYLVAGARHAQSYRKNREGYERAVKDFLKRYRLT